MLEVIKAGLVAFSKNFNPMVAVEFGRRSIFDDSRPTFREMEQALRGGKAWPGRKVRLNLRSS